MCYMVSLEILNPDSSCKSSLILIKHRPQIPLVGLNSTKIVLRQTYKQLGYRTLIPSDNTIN